jgi:hypothetical protein
MDDAEARLTLGLTLSHTATLRAQLDREKIDHSDLDTALRALASSWREHHAPRDTPTSPVGIALAFLRKRNAETRRRQRAEQRGESIHEDREAFQRALVAAVDSHLARLYEKVPPPPVERAPRHATLYTAWLHWWNRAARRAALAEVATLDDGTSPVAILAAATLDRENSRDWQASQNGREPTIAELDLLARLDAYLAGSREDLDPSPMPSGPRLFDSALTALDEPL